MPLATLIHPDIESHLDAWLASRGYVWEQLERGEVMHGKRVLSPTTLQLLIAHSDPVLFAETYFVERDGPFAGESWRFFDYQKPSMRYRGDTVHECGAEVGKTREIVALAIWMGLGFGPVPLGEGLIGAAQDGHLDSIWDQLLFQLKSNPLLEARVDWEATRVKPYRKLVFLNGNVVHLRPAGFDGEAFRGLHCALFLMGDEYAKLANPKAFDEFYRAALPGCEIRIYSTPDGNRGSRFFAICQQSIVVDLAKLLAGKKLTPDAPDVDVALRFRWSKTMMPPPFWDEARRQKLIDRYGGIDSPGYQQNVFGNWGDAANSVFPWEQFEPCTRYLPDFVDIRILWNDAERQYLVTAFRLNPSFSSAARLGDEAERGPQPLIPILDDAYDASNFDLAALLRSLLSPRPGHHVAGIDCGATDDPTEILVSEVLPRGTRDRARIQLKRFTYPGQRSAVRVVDEILSPDYGYGIDATGVGVGLEHLLNEGESGWSLSGRLSGIVMNAKQPDINPDTGEVALEPGTDKPRMATNKELSTRLLQLDVQRREYEAPKHPEFLTQFTNHTAHTSKAGNRVFDSTNDHLIEAKRVQRLRLLEMTFVAPVEIPAEVGVGWSRPALEID